TGAGSFTLHDSPLGVSRVTAPSGATPKMSTPLSDASSASGGALARRTVPKRRSTRTGIPFVATAASSPDSASHASNRPSGGPFPAERHTAESRVGYTYATTGPPARATRSRTASGPRREGDAAPGSEDGARRSVPQATSTSAAVRTVGRTATN